MKYPPGLQSAEGAEGGMLLVHGLQDIKRAMLRTFEGVCRHHSSAGQEGDFSPSIPGQDYACTSPDAVTRVELVADRLSANEWSAVPPATNCAPSTAPRFPIAHPVA